MKKKWCRNLLGYCPTVSQYSEKLYCDTAGLESAVGSKCIARVCSGWKNCIAMGGWMVEGCITIHYSVL